MPLVLTGIFIALLVIFAVTPDPSSSNADVAPTSEPTAGPRECVICPIAQTCDPDSGQCKLVESTPLPCVQGAAYDEKAGFCLPTGAPPAPSLEPSTGLDDFPPGIRQPRRPRRDRGVFD